MQNFALGMANMIKLSLSIQELITPPANLDIDFCLHFLLCKEEEIDNQSLYWRD